MEREGKKESEAVLGVVGSVSRGVGRVRGGKALAESRGWSARVCDGKGC